LAKGYFEVEEEAMGDLEHDGRDSPSKPSESSGMAWPRIVLVVGLFLVFLALGLGAALKESAGLAPKVLVVAGVAFMALGGLAYLVVFLKAKLNGKRATPAKS
jgi:hypothetical protein